MREHLTLEPGPPFRRLHMFRSPYVSLCRRTGRREFDNRRVLRRLTAQTDVLHLGERRDGNRLGDHEGVSERVRMDLAAE